MSRRLTGFSPVVRRQIKERAGVTTEFVRCEGCGFWVAEEFIELHHRRARRAGGSKRPDTNLAANSVCLCRRCHTWCESNRTEATDKGWLISQFRKDFTPSMIPVLLHDGWFILDDRGDRQSVPTPIGAPQ